MRRFILAALAACVVVCAWATMPTVTVTLDVSNPDGTFPSTAPYATAQVTWTQSGDPAVHTQTVSPAYDATTGKLTWTVPQNSQIKVNCPSYGISAQTYSVATSNVLINGLTPVSAPIVSPAYMNNYALLAGAAFSGAVSAPSFIGPLTGTASGNLTASDLMPYAQLGTANTWGAGQIFPFLYVAGSPPASDVATTSSTIAGQSAYPLATVNTAGGDIDIASGLGVRVFTVTDYTQLVDTNLRLDLDAETSTAIDYLLGEGVEWSASTSNTATATNIAAAVNAYCPGVSAQPSGASVYITRTGMTKSITLSYTATAGISTTAGADGQIHLIGTVTNNATTTQNGPLALAGTTTMPPSAVNQQPGATSLLSYPGVVFTVPTGMLWTPSRITSGSAGQIMILVGDGGSLTLNSGSAFYGSGNWTSTGHSVLALIYTGSAWVELFRSNNA